MIVKNKQTNPEQLEPKNSTPSHFPEAFLQDLDVVVTFLFSMVSGNEIANTWVNGTEASELRYALLLFPKSSSTVTELLTTEK